MLSQNWAFAIHYKMLIIVSSTTLYSFAVFPLEMKKKHKLVKVSAFILQNASDS
jgi:hypothetical protein